VAEGEEVRFAISFEADDRESTHAAFVRIVEILRAEAEELGCRNLYGWRNVIEIKTGLRDAL
jgi:hypothetical protein